MLDGLSRDPMMQAPSTHVTAATMEHHGGRVTRGGHAADVYQRQGPKGGRCNAKAQTLNLCTVGLLKMQMACEDVKGKGTASSIHKGFWNPADQWWQLEKLQMFFL